MTDNTIDLSNLKAELTPYSSVVGTSIALVSKDGPIVALLMVSVPNPQFDYKATALPIAKEIVELWNARPREAALEAEIADLRAQITDPRTVTITRARYEEYQAAEYRLAAYEGQITAESGWQKVYDEFEDQFFAPADIIVLLAWEEVWPEPRWAFEVGVYRSTKGGWIHGRATHWQNLPAPPHALSTKREEG